MLGVSELLPLPRLTGLHDITVLKDAGLHGPVRTRTRDTGHQDEDTGTLDQNLPEPELLLIRVLGQPGARGTFDQDNPVQPSGTLRLSSSLSCVSD